MTREVEIGGEVFVVTENEKTRCRNYAHKKTGITLSYALALFKAPSAEGWVENHIKTQLHRVQAPVAAPIKPIKFASKGPETNYEGSEILREISDQKNMPHLALIAHRGWKPDFERGYIISLNSPTAWVPKVELSAICLNSRHGQSSTPQQGCTCGIYALRHPNDSLIHQATIMGEVYLWGRVLHGVRGYRAQFAYPKSFTVTRKAWWVEPLLGRYEVPINYRAS